MILQMCRFLYSNNPLITILPILIRDRWEYAPYHLRIELLDATHGFWNCSEEEKNQLVEAIRSIQTDNIWISTAITDALKSLGAIQSDGYEEIIRQEIEQVLSDPEVPESWALARNIYNCQFDHPYDNIYWEVVHELPDIKRKEFLSLAVRSKDDFRMFVSLMIRDLAAFDDPTTGKYIEHWTELPPEHSPIPQDALEVFVTSHIVLGRLHHPLPPKNYGNSTDKDAMNACGEVYYWSNRNDVNQDERIERCKTAWEILFKHEAEASLIAIKECEAILKENLRSLNAGEPTKTSLLDYFSANIAEISRKALSSDITWHPKNTWMREKQVKLFCFALDMLGAYGKTTDLALLRRKIDCEDLGKVALRAIRSLEDRQVSNGL